MIKMRDLRWVRWLGDTEVTTPARHTPFGDWLVLFRFKNRPGVYDVSLVGPFSYRAELDPADPDTQDEQTTLFEGLDALDALVIYNAILDGGLSYDQD